MERKEFDCVIIGGGPAGMKAALSATSEGVSVVIVSKNKVGKSGNGTIAGGGHAAPGIQDDTKSIFIDDVLKSGRGINNKKLVKKLAEAGLHRVKELAQIGVEFERDNGNFLLHRDPGHSSARTLYPERGKGAIVNEKLFKEVRRQNIAILNDLVVLDLITEKNHVSGILGLSRKTGEFVYLATSTCILCTGGGGQIYKSNDNTRGSTGDGYRIALTAGLRLIDMEFVQFYPAVMVHPLSGVLISPPIFERGGRLYNAKEERFIEKYAPERLELATRDVKSRAIYQEIRKGNDVNGGVLLDLSHVERKDIQKYTPALYDAFHGRVEELYETDLVIRPSAHYFMGGVVIDEHCRTGIKGLYAAGEVVGGIHGANRLANNALTACHVFGHIAGKNARQHARHGQKNTNDLKKVRERIREWKACQGEEQKGKKVAQIQNEIKEIMWDKVGIVRREKNLSDALTELFKVKQSLENISCRERTDVIRLAETKSLLRSGLAITKVALLRQESRGAHYREDFPQERTIWKKHIFIEEENGKISTQMT
ncbi:MAG: FAD-binding protein [Candidatus Korarchaeota archaeon]|nr:FAD-binding protein [Candidatus Korarchaeota archaeon]NIU84547.1 FAD-binding protein [Candidatus Thorarchaeota archaeon]NIW14614.1 FAD-binding protein [Candidatus Thorarchaeota archaeon]NIW52686.1 FAD-binding protein [Candidatus Korarchaeota archaeon]